MNQAFYTGIIGLQTHQYGMDIVSDNLANVNSVGYRGSRAEFASLFENSVNQVTQSSSVTSTIGVGSRVHATMMTQQGGTLINGDRSTDLAIGGNGWFGIQDANNTLYTRAGDFYFDADSNLVTAGGKHLLGTMGNNMTNKVLTQPLNSVALGKADAQVPLNFPSELTYPVSPTTTASFYGNIGTEDAERIMSAKVIAPDNQINRLRLLYTLSPVQPATGSSWDVAASITSADGATTYDSQSGTVLFDANGGLASHNLSAMNNNGAPVAIELGQGYTGIKSISDLNIEMSSQANGIVSGDLIGYTINKDAEVIASFSNGDSSAVGKVALFHFQNDQGLERISGTHFRESNNSGNPIFYTDADGNYILGADIYNNKLENSNVRIEVGLTELIIMQRSFDANAKCVTTGDELIQKALQM